MGEHMTRKENELGQEDGILRAEPGHCAWSKKTVLREWACPELFSCALRRVEVLPLSEYEWKLGKNSH